MEENEEVFKKLDEKFQSYHPTADYYKYKKWVIHDWIYYGSNTGLELIYRTDKELWEIRQVLDSGYSTGTVLTSTTEFRNIELWTEVLRPTNDKYKTDRK
jgi:hypothetical protein